MMFELKREKARIIEMKAKEAVLAAVNGSGQKRRVVELFIVTEVPLSDSAIAAFETLVPNLGQQLKAIAMRIEDGGAAIVVQAKAKIPAMTLDLHPTSPKSAPVTFHWTVAESKGATFRIDKKGDGLVRMRWKVRATKGDLDKTPDWLGADMLISAAQTQVTVEEINKRAAEEGKAPKVDKDPNAPKKNKKKGAAEQGDLPIVDAEAVDTDAPKDAGADATDVFNRARGAGDRALPGKGETTGSEKAPDPDDSKDPDGGFT